LVSTAADGPAIAVETLSKTYRDGLLGRRQVHALRGVSFDVGRGEIFGLLGPNGAGKTTLIKVLLGVVRRSGGQAFLLGRPAGERRSRRRVGYLPEHHRIPRHHTGDTALAYYGALSGLSQAEVRRRRPALLEMVGLVDWGAVSIGKYSKGMQQRLGLAQALLHEPDLLVLDEPTDGVDPVGRSEMRAVLRRLKDEGKTIFLNSHLLQEIELICDRVAILNLGELVRLGNVAELTQQPETSLTFSVAGEERLVREAIAGWPRAEVQLLAAVNQFEIEVSAAGQPDIDRYVDDLRLRGVSILSFSRSRQTLEEAFMSIITTARGAK